MRVAGIIIAMASLSLASCATKSVTTANGPGCGALTGAQWSAPVQAGVKKTFDNELKRKFGDTNIYLYVDRSTNERGDSIFTVRRIGPAKFQMPENGKGGEVEVVLQACTAKVLKVRKLADLEVNPLPLNQSDEPENQ